MPKINDKVVYPQDEQMSMEDYLIGSNYNTASKKTQTFSLGSIFSLFYNFLGFNAFLNTTDTTTYPVPTPGCMYAYDGDDNLTDDLSEVVKITFSSQDTYSFEAATYFEQIVNSGKFIFKFINLEDKDNFVFFTPSNFVLNGTGTAFDVDVSIFSNLENGTFVNYKKYLLVLEFNPSAFNPADYDLSDFTNTSGDPFINESDLITALNNLGVYNTIITDAGFVKSGQDFTGNLGSEWNINGDYYTNALDVDITITLAASGYHRWDRIVLNTSNTFVLVQGVEVLLAEEPPVPTLPVNTLEYTLFRVTSTDVGDITPPVVGDLYVKKSYAQTSVDSITTGADASVPIPANGSSCIRLGNASLTSVACLNLTAIIGNSNAEVPYPGKIFEIMNGTGSDVEIKHATGADIQFTTKDGNSIIIPNNESLFVKYDADGLLELFRSWSDVDLSGKLDKSTTPSSVYGTDISGGQTMISIDVFVEATDFTNHITNTSNPHNVTKSQVGLSNVDNTSDLDKPISTATQNALNLKEDVVNKATDLTSPDNTKYPTTLAVSTALSGKQDTLINTGNGNKYLGDDGEYTFVDWLEITNKPTTFPPSAHTHTVSDITDMPAIPTSTSDLTNDGEDGTSTYVEHDELGEAAFSNDYNDLDNLPIIPTPLTNHSELTLDDGTNPHGTTKSDVGLGNVDNTSDLTKPISTATQTALDLKQDKDISLYGDIPLPLEDTDKLWINRSGTWYKVDKSELGGGDFLEKDIATYPIASFPLADTDKLILFQGGVPKKIDKSDIHKETTITVELMNSLTSDFYAPNDLIIHSTDIIRGSGTITLKVENVAYTLGQLITRGNKITVETTTPSVYNLNTTPTNTNWQRPADWLPMPTNITATDQTFVGLHAVIDNSDNYCAFSFTTSAGQYRVDWGDGNVTLHNSGTIAQHQYNYASVSNATLSSRGYKQAMVTVTPVSGDLLTCNFQQRFVTTPVQNQSYSSGFLECILSMPNASSGQSIILGGGTIIHTYYEKVDIKTIGDATILIGLLQNCYSLQSVPLFNTINVTNMQTMFQNCFLLQYVPLFNTINVANMASMFQSCFSLQSVPLFNTINVTNMSSMLLNCYSLQSVPLFNTSNVTNMGAMFYGCYSLQSVPLFNTINVTNMSYMLVSCFSLQYVPLLNTINVTNMSNMFNSCRSLNFIPAFLTTAVTSDFTNFANNCYSLNRILMSFNRAVSIQNCQLSKDAIVEIFTNLVDRTSTTSANIDITGNWGASALTASDRLIATNKNWVITG